MAKPTEIKKMTALLNEDADSAEDMAKKVWALVDQLLAEREQWVVAAVHPTLKGWQCVGPYATQNQALKDYAKRVQGYDEQSKVYLTKLVHPSNINLD